LREALLLSLVQEGNRLELCSRNLDKYIIEAGAKHGYNLSALATEAVQAKLATKSLVNAVTDTTKSIISVKQKTEAKVFLSGTRRWGSVSGTIDVVRQVPSGNPGGYRYDLLWIIPTVKRIVPFMARTDPDLNIPAAVALKSIRSSKDPMNKRRLQITFMNLFGECLHIQPEINNSLPRAEEWLSSAIRALTLKLSYPNFSEDCRKCVFRSACAANGDK
jgi:hypothetical protein